jgi:hypothetical protein
MSYVKALFGHITGEGLSLKEGQIGFIEDSKKHILNDLVKRGLVIVKDSHEEAEAFKFISRQELFNKSYKSLNPPDGEDAPVSLIDWSNSQPTIIKGVPSNYIIEEEPKKEVKKSVTPPSDK